jgi:hypothetical protein
MQLTPREQHEVMLLEQRWGKLLDAGTAIKDREIRQNMAIVLENAQRDADRQHQLLNESNVSFGTGGMGAQPNGAFGAYTPGVYGSDTDGTRDARVPTIIIPMLRRVFPNLIAHDLVGVQPLKNSPIGFVFALRAQYGRNRQFAAGSTTSAGVEIGYNNIDSSFAGAAGSSSSASGDYWNAYAGGISVGGGAIEYNGVGAGLSSAEWAKLGVDMPTANFKLVKATVEAATRKLGASYSLELAEDLKNQHGLDADSEMVNILSYEIQAEIDRQLVSEMVRSAIAEGNVSNWSPVSADGRNQIERVGTLYTQILDKSNDIAIQTRMGAGNFVVASPRVTALLQRVNATVSVKLDDGNKLPDNKVGTGAISRVGVLADTHALYRDTFAGGNYALCGYKGNTAYASGVIYAPYIPLQVFRAQGPDDGNPRLAVRTRDAIIGESGRPQGFEAGKFYQFIKIDGLTSAVLGDDSGSRLFMYA